MFTHPLIAAAVQIIVALLTGNWLAGGLIMAGFYLGRELTAAEYRWIETYGGGLRANMPWWGAFDRRVWSKADHFLDWILPCVTVAVIYAISEAF